MNNRVCRVVKATIVPAVGPVPSRNCRPATKYTSTGVIEKKVETTAKKARPTICWRTWSRARRSFCSWYRAASRSCRPKTLASSTPETESDSWVMALISARAPWVSPVMARRSRPTRPVSQTKSGSMTSDSRVSCQLSTAIAISVEIRMTELLSSVLAVSVMTLCRPPTSFWSRLWISPVRVPVKKRNDSDCRWLNSVARRSRITCWPTRLEW